MMGQEHAALTVSGESLEVVSLTGEEELSTLFRFDVVCRSSAAHADTRSLLGAEAAITLRDAPGNERTVVGLVAGARIRQSASAGATLALVIRPQVFPLTLGRDSYVLHDVDVVGVARDVLADYAGPVDYRVTRRYRSRAYCAQYREDDWSFLSRLLEEEGIYYWFDQDGGRTVLAFSDDSTSAPDLPGGAYVRFRHQTGMRAADEHVDELGAVATMTPGRFTVGSFDPQRPLFKVMGSAGQSGLEVYDAPGGGPEGADDCARRAEVMREAALCAAKTVRGSTTSVRFVPGRVVEIGEHPLARLDGRYLLTAVHTEVSQRVRASGEAAFAYRSSFRAVPAHLAFRPAERTPPAKQAGLQTGVVGGAPGSEIFPDPTGRVRVQLHWDRLGTRDHGSGRWMRVAQRNSADSMLLPRVGWNVATFNEEGTVDAPRVLSRLCDAEHMPPYPLPENKTRTVFKTATTPGAGSFNEIRFEDRLGAEQMFINASRDMTVLVKNGKTEGILRDAARSVAVDRDLDVAVTFSEAVGKDQSVTIGGNESVKAGATIASVVGGDESITVAGKRSIKSDDHRITAKGTRTLQVGAAMIDVSLGTIGAQSRKNGATTVGGVVVRVAKETINESSKVGIQTIGGARLEFCGGKRSLAASLACVQTVGGLMVLKTADAYTESSRTNLTYLVGARVSGEAPCVWIEAKKEIVLRSGSSTITIKPDRVAISTPKLDLTAAEHLEVRTALIEHN